MRTLSVARRFLNFLDKMIAERVGIVFSAPFEKDPVDGYRQGLITSEKESGFGRIQCEKIV
jgi:hypothetical protein